MNILYLIICSIILIYTFTRKLDFLSLAAIGFVVYTMNLATGIVFIPRSATSYYYYEKVSMATYIINIVQMGIIFFYTILNDTIRIKKVFKVSSSFKEMNFSYEKEQGFKWLLWFAIIATIYSVVKVGPSIFTMHKNDIGGKLDIFYSLSIWVSLVTLTYGLDKNKKTFIIASLIPIFTNVFIGSRAYIATAVVIIFVSKWRTISKNIFSNFKLYCGGGLLALSLLIYKEVYQNVRSLDIQQILETLSNPETYSNVFSFYEPSIVLSIYDYVLSYGYRLSLNDTIVRIFSIIPFINDLIPMDADIRFSAIVMEDIFQAGYGLASSFWGETYAMLNWAGIVVATFLWLKILRMGNSQLNKKSNLKYFIIPGVAYLSFYIHRLDIVQAMGAFKLLIMIYFIWVSICHIMHILCSISVGGKICDKPIP